MIKFEDLGLTKNESKAYEVLVKFGKMSAGEISAKSEVPYGRVYGVLSSLVNKGIINVVPERTKKFIAGDPQSLFRIVEEKERKLTEMREKIKELKGFYDIKDKNPVVMGVGRNGFYKIVSQAAEGNKYAYNIKWTAEYKPDWVENRKKKLRKGVDVKELVRYNEETKRNVRDWIKISKNMKKIENEGVAFSVVDDEEVLIGLIKSNVTLLIRDKPFAKIMRQLFLAYYMDAEKID